MIIVVRESRSGWGNEGGSAAFVQIKKRAYCMLRYRSFRHGSRSFEGATSQIDRILRYAASHRSPLPVPPISLLLAVLPNARKELSSQVCTKKVVLC